MTGRAPNPRVGLILLALLACNTTYYLYAGRLSEALDSVAWYVLLLLFMWETARAHSPRARAVLASIHVLRSLATLAIATSAVLYVREQEWLDATNLCFWIAVVGLLEIEVRFPTAIDTHRRVFVSTAALLYGGLATLVLIWLARAEWMDAWDAALWLAAFGLLELRVLSGMNEKK